ncbi:hypothetical protein ANRL3_01090 [Anaerolineae bacterium]|nr:hypothetical protein ANRL3_01090 [Anaerolineae bacterium]
MNNQLLIGIRRFVFGIPRPLWQRQVADNAKRTRAHLGFMTAEHHAVRDFVVRELPRVGKPLSPQFIAAQLSLPVARVNEILAKLERKKTFLFRNADGAVVWAYPVTVEQTPHRVTFSTGEQVYSA